MLAVSIACPEAKLDGLSSLVIPSDEQVRVALAARGDVDKQVWFISPHSRLGIFVRWFCLAWVTM